MLIAQDRGPTRPQLGERHGEGQPPPRELNLSVATQPIRKDPFRRCEPTENFRRHMRGTGRQVDTHHDAVRERVNERGGPGHRRRGVDHDGVITRLSGGSERSARRLVGTRWME